jgi:hypothetical protein
LSQNTGLLLARYLAVALTFPDSSAPLSFNPGLFGPNFQFTEVVAAVPEPSTYLLFATGLLGGVTWLWQEPLPLLKYLAKSNPVFWLKLCDVDSALSAVYRHA